MTNFLNLLLRVAPLVIVGGCGDLGPIDLGEEEKRGPSCEASTSLAWGGGGAQGEDVSFLAVWGLDRVLELETASDGSLNDIGRQTMGSFGLDPSDPGDLADYEYVFFSPQLHFEIGYRGDPSRLRGIVYQLEGEPPSAKFEASVVDVGELMEARRAGRLEEAAVSFRDMVRTMKAGDQPVVIAAMCSRVADCLWEAGSEDRAISGEVTLSNIQTVAGSDNQTLLAGSQKRTYVYGDLSIFADFEGDLEVSGESICLSLGPE